VGVGAETLILPSEQRETERRKPEPAPFADNCLHEPASQTEPTSKTLISVSNFPEGQIRQVKLLRELPQVPQLNLCQQP
jgi:hypothetical protein